MKVQLVLHHESKNFAVWTLPAGMDGGGFGGLYLPQDTVAVAVEVTQGARKAGRAA